MNILFIDDEEHVANGIIDSIHKYCQVNQIVFSSSYTNLPALIQAHSFDVILTDIRIDQELSFKYLDAHKELIGDIPIVFISAHEDYALYSIKYRPFEYLLKPLDIEKLKITLENIKNNTQSTSSIAKSIIGFSTNKGIQFVNVSDIINLRADSNYTKIYLTNKKSIIVSKTLGKVEQEINDQNCFIRVGRSDIINILFVKEFKSGRKSKVVMKDGQEVPVSSDRKNDIKKLFNII